MSLKRQPPVPVRIGLDDRAVYVKALRTALDIGDAAIEHLLDRVTPMDLKGGEVLFEEGDFGDAMYLVLDGRLRVLKGDHEIRPVAEILRGELVGEMALLNQTPIHIDLFKLIDENASHLVQKQPCCDHVIAQGSNKHERSC